MQIKSTIEQAESGPAAIAAAAAPAAAVAAVVAAARAATDTVSLSATGLALAADETSPASAGASATAAARKKKRGKVAWEVLDVDAFRLIRESLRQKNLGLKASGQGKLKAIEPGDAPKVNAPPAP